MTSHLNVMLYCIHECVRFLPSLYLISLAKDLQSHLSFVLLSLIYTKQLNADSTQTLATSIGSKTETYSSQKTPSGYCNTSAHKDKTKPTQRDIIKSDRMKGLFRRAADFRKGPHRRVKDAAGPASQGMKMTTSQVLEPSTMSCVHQPCHHSQ